MWLYRIGLKGLRGRDPKAAPDHPPSPRPAAPADPVWNSLTSEMERRSHHALAEHLMRRNNARAAARSGQHSRTSSCGGSWVNLVSGPGSPSATGSVAGSYDHLLDHPDPSLEPARLRSRSEDGPRLSRRSMSDSLPVSESAQHMGALVDAGDVPHLGTEGEGDSEGRASGRLANERRLSRPAKPARAPVVSRRSAWVHVTSLWLVRMPVSLALLLSETLLDFCRRVARSGTVIMKLTVKDWTQGLSTLSLRASTCTSAATHSVSSVLAPFVTRAVDVVGDAALGVATVTGTTVLAAWGGACGAVSGTARASATLARGCAALASRLWHAACSEARAQWASACAVARTVRRDLAALPSPRLAEAAAWSCSVVLVAGAMHCATRALLGAAAETSGEVAALKEQVQRQGAAIEELCSILRNFKEHQIQIEAAMTAPRFDLTRTTAQDIGIWSHTSTVAAAAKRLCTATPTELTFGSPLFGTASIRA